MPPEQSPEHPPEQSPQQPPAPEEVAVALSAGLSLLYRRMRRPLAPGELTLPERSALSRIERSGPATAAELARQEQISPQSLGATLAMLERRGLLERSPDPQDGRRIMVSLTAAGQAAVRAKRAAASARLTEALSADFSAAERAQLLAIAPLLERLAEQL